MTQKPINKPLSGRTHPSHGQRKQGKSHQHQEHVGDLCWRNLFLWAERLTSITTGRFSNIWGSKSNENVQKGGKTKTGSFTMTMCWCTLLCQCNFRPLKTWLWYPTLLNRLIWSLVFSLFPRMTLYLQACHFQDV
jgi:hypothetical protein